jgi:hypothetical protein
LRMKVEKNKILKYSLNILPIPIIVVFFILNYLTPIIADDFYYSFIFGTYERVTSISDIIISQYDHYMNWGGRSIVHFFIQLFLSFGDKIIFNIVNTIIYVIFVLLMQFHITGSLKKINSILFSTITILLWFLVPAYGQNFLWLTGSCNYLWTTTLILFFLIPYRKKNENSNYKLNFPLSVLFFFLGILAGWSIENSGAAVLFLLISYFGIKMIKKEKVSFFEIAGFIGFIIGFCVLIAAPGNFGRAITDFNPIMADSFPIRLVKRFYTTTKIFFQHGGFFLACLAFWLGYDLILHQKRKLNIFMGYYFIAGMVGVYSMVFSPNFPDRAFFIYVVFLCITILNLLTQTKIEFPNSIKRNIPIFSIAFLIYFSFSFFMAGSDIVRTHMKWEKRIHYIREQKAKAILDIEVEAIPAWDKHNALGGDFNRKNNRLEDLWKDANSWVNTFTAAYFGIDSIKAIETPWKQK